MQMIEHAKKTYEHSKLHFKVLDIENDNDFASYTNRFDKIFSFFCFHWIHNKANALNNMNTMLKSGGEILMHFMLINPIVELYKVMDAEWQTFVKVSLYLFIYYTFDYFLIYTTLFIRYFAIFSDID